MRKGARPAEFLNTGYFEFAGAGESCIKKPCRLAGFSIIYYKILFQCCQ